MTAQTILSTGFFLSLLFVSPVLGQEINNDNIARNLVVADAEATGGDILVNGDEGLVRASTPYDKRLFGVVVELPSVSLNEVSAETKPVVSSGEAKVNVSSRNGEIKTGDFVTSSSEAGVGQKATESGFVLGKALEDLTSSEGQISVLLTMQFETIQNSEELGGVDRVLRLLTTGLEDPANFPVVLRYIFAVILALISLGFGYISFVRTLRKGIEAIGRNPLARGTIQLAMVFNLLGVIIISLAGLGLALLIIVY